VALFSECHELFGHEQFRKEAADLAVQTMRRGRKTAITLAFDTQSSRADAIPPKIVELVKVNACFAVKSWQSNDGFLGNGSFQAGIRATELRPGKDVGTSLLTGATDERFEILKWFYIEADDTGYDAAAEVIERAMSEAGTDDVDAVSERRDLLDDLATVLGNERVPEADVPARLRDLAPTYEPYRRLTGVGLREVLEREYGIKVPSTGNRYPVDPVAIRNRVAEGPTVTSPKGREGGRRKRSGLPRVSRADTAERVKGTRQLVGLSAAAAYADVSTRTLRRYIAQGRLTGYRVGPRLVKVDLSELDQLARPIPTARGPG
jgi:S-DNA-T family DNA segregation ATPase FtsK/SpoIIIE